MKTLVLQRVRMFQQLESRTTFRESHTAVNQVVPLKSVDLRLLWYGHNDTVKLTMGVCTLHQSGGCAD